MANDEQLDNINLRILRVTEDLRLIQRELNSAAMQAPSSPELLEAFNDVTEIETLEMLKAVLDQMRHFLWFYFEVMADDSEIGEQLRKKLRQSAAPAAVTDQRTSQDQAKWPTDAALIRLLADGRNRKPN